MKSFKKSGGYNNLKEDDKNKQQKIQLTEFDKEIIDYIKRELSDIIPQYKIDTYEHAKMGNKFIKHLSTNSNMQMAEITKDKHDYYRLATLLTKHIPFIPRQNPNQTALDLLKRYKKDSDIYSDIFKMRLKQQSMFPSIQTYSNEIRDKTHATMYYDYIKRFLPNDFKITNYLDYGCGDCGKSIQLGHLLGLSPESIYGVDVKPDTQEFGHYDEKRKLFNEKLNFEYVDSENNNLDVFKNNPKFSLITMFMVLHHVHNLNALFKQLYTITADSAYLVIREHDAYNAADYMLCDIEHGIYDLTYKNMKSETHYVQNVTQNPQNPNFAQNYWAKYYNWIEWTYLLSKYGFKYITHGYDNNSIKQEISTTRYMYMIFKKKL
jgi:SAM-dependent methyltransferase